MQRAMMCLFGLCLVGCGLPEGYETSRDAQLATHIIQPQGLKRVQKTAALKDLRPTGSPFTVLPRGTVAQPMIDITIFNQQTFDMKKHTPKFRIAVNYPNLSHCGLRFASTAKSNGTAAQWKSLLDQFQINPASPSSWGTQVGEIPRPTTEVRLQGGKHHIEIRFAGPQLYLMYMFLQTRSSNTWRETLQTTLGLKEGETLLMSPIACP